jgi:hypothetical protein
VRINVPSLSSLMKMETVLNVLNTVTNVTSRKRSVNNARRITTYSTIFNVSTNVPKDTSKTVKHVLNVQILCANAV